MYLTPCAEQHAWELQSVKVSCAYGCLNPSLTVLPWRGEYSSWRARCSVQQALEQPQQCAYRQQQERAVVEKQLRLTG